MDLVPSTSARAPGWVMIIGLALMLWGGEYVLRDLWEPDEARYAYIAQEMRDTGSWAVPHRHGVYYAHKPPLMFWLINAGATLTTAGEINRVSTRLPSLLGAILSLWAIAGVARRWAGATTAWSAVLVTATTYLFWNKGGMGQIDSLLCGLVTLAFYHLVAYEDDRQPWRPLLAYSAMGLAVLAKGPVGFLVPFGMYLAGTGVARDGTRRRFLHAAWGPLLTLLFPAAWLAWVWAHNPPDGYMHELLFKQNVGRASGDMGHVKPFYYYLENFPIQFLPWTALWFFIRPAYRDTPDARPAMRRLLAAVAFVVIFFSLSPSKRELYLLPAFPPAALLVAWAWPAAARYPGRALGRYCWGLPAAFGLAMLGAAATHAFKPVLPFPGNAFVGPGMLALAGAFLLRRIVQREGRCTSAVLFTFAGVMLAVQIAVGVSVYPASNAFKAPYTVAEAAERYLAPDEPIYLFKMNGEIMALYAHRPGRAIEEGAELEQTLRARGHGLVVAELKRVQDLPPAVLEHATRQDFRMGNKTLLWAYVDFSAPAPTAP